MTETTTSPLLGRCKTKGCGFTLFATDKDVKSAETWRDVKPGGAYRLNNGYVSKCPNGHTGFALKRIKGTYSPDHQCDSRCLQARGNECTCSCGGANHGRGHVATIVHEAKDQVEETKQDRHLGEVGKHIVGKAIVRQRREVRNGDTILYKFTTEDHTASITWFCPSYADPSYEVGQTVEFRAKVKAHEDHERFGKSTIVTYLEEVE